MFHVGQMVECINDDHPHGWFGPAPVVKGAVYKVSGHYDGPGDPALFFAGIANPPAGCMASRFRPLQDSKLEVFRALLVDLPALPKFDLTKERV